MNKKGRQSFLFATLFSKNRPYFCRLMTFPCTALCTNGKRWIVRYNQNKEFSGLWSIISEEILDWWRKRFLCLVLLQVPKCFGLVQFFCARPKIYLHIVAVTNILCQTKRWFAFSKIGFCVKGHSISLTNFWFDNTSAL